MFPSAHTACSQTWACGDDSNLTNLGTAPWIKKGCKIKQRKTQNKMKYMYVRLFLNLILSRLHVLSYFTLF